ncbi:disulfide bond formation protein B [Roseobacter sp.]|uniref:disulfide bond formation protein B n=1 Tax=Roseobacter sp. TaxID=1907202 RepID=UPI00385860CC
MTRTQAVAIASLGSLALLLGAFAFQHIGGLPPCKMCIWQRYPHVSAVVFGAMALSFQNRVLIIAGALAALASGLIGLFHVGVEQGWWDGPTTCSSGPVGGVSPQELLDQILTAPLVRCDEIAWDLFGISMAGWNAIVSFSLVALWLLALKRS